MITLKQLEKNNQFRASLNRLKKLNPKKTVFEFMIAHEYNRRHNRLQSTNDRMKTETWTPMTWAFIPTTFKRFFN